MEYFDYKTNKPIRRDKYIANGIERGKLLLKEYCGCVVIQDQTADAYIVYCPKHKAAPDMYEACRKGLELLSINLEQYRGTVSELLREALAKAEGK